MKKILAIDWGGKRIGTAMTNTIARLPKPLMQIPNNDKAIEVISRIVEDESIDIAVVGLPRNLSGEETAQSAAIRRFAGNLEEAVQCQVVLQDETLSTHAATSLKKQFPDADIDSLAATIILGDYLESL